MLGNAARGKNVFHQSEHLVTFSVSANQITHNFFGQEKTHKFTHKYRVVNNGLGHQIFFYYWTETNLIE